MRHYGATLLAQAFVSEGMKNVAAGANPIVLRRGMKKATDVAVEAIANMSSKVDGKNQIARVAAISAGDDEVGQLVADAMEKVSNDGVITIEKEDGVPVGFANLMTIYSIWTHGKALILDDLYLDPAVRGKGYGRKALEFIEGLNFNEKEAFGIITTHYQNLKHFH